MNMAEFFVAAGPLLLTGQATSGIAPTRKFAVLFWHEKGECSYNGDLWDFRVYAPEEQRRIDAERAAIDADTPARF